MGRLSCSTASNWARCSTVLGQLCKRLAPSPAPLRWQTDGNAASSISRPCEFASMSSKVHRRKCRSIRCVLACRRCITSPPGTLRSIMNALAASCSKWSSHHLLIVFDKRLNALPKSLPLHRPASYASTNLISSTSMSCAVNVFIVMPQPSKKGASTPFNALAPRVLTQVPTITLPAYSAILGGSNVHPTRSLHLWVSTLEQTRKLGLPCHSQHQHALGLTSS